MVVFHAVQVPHVGREATVDGHVVDCLEPDVCLADEMALQQVRERGV